MRDSVLWKRALAIVVVVVVASVGILWFAPLSEITFRLANPEYESVTIGVFVDAGRCEPGEEDMIVDLGPQRTVSKDYRVRAGAHEISFAWRFSSDDSSEPYSYATTHPLYVELRQFGNEDVELTVFSA